VTAADDKEPDVHRKAKLVSCPDPNVTTALAVIVKDVGEIKGHLVELNGHNAEAAAKISALERINLEEAAAKKAKKEERAIWQKREDDRKEKEDEDIRRDIGNSRWFLGWLVSIAALSTGVASFIVQQVWGG